MIRLRGVAVVLACVPALVFSAGCHGQAAFTQGLGSKIWVGRYQEIEEYLRTGECVSMESLQQILTRCTLRPGGPFARMAWKALPPGVHRGFSESYRTEIATYELDKLLKVPPSVERQIQGNKGAAQLWVENVVDGTDTTPPPPLEKVHWEAQLVRMTMFDSLIGNRDRNQRNMLRDRAWNLILLDHSRSFTAGAELVQKLNRVDETFWTKIEGVTLDELNRSLSPWIDESQIKGILDRRDKMRLEIKSLPK
jgi:hypothetical protein